MLKLTTSVRARVFATVADTSPVTWTVGVQDTLRSARAVRISEIVWGTDAFW